MDLNPVSTDSEPVLTTKDLALIEQEQQNKKKKEEEWTADQQAAFEEALR